MTDRELLCVFSGACIGFVLGIVFIIAVLTTV